MCVVLHIKSFFFYPSTSSTTGVRVDSSILLIEEIQTSSVVTKLRHIRDSTLPRTWYAVRTATPCHYTIIISLAIWQFAAWSSTWITHNFPERRKHRKQKETHAPSLPPFRANFRLVYIDISGDTSHLVQNGSIWSCFAHTWSMFWCMLQRIAPFLLGFRLETCYSINISTDVSCVCGREYIFFTEKVRFFAIITGDHS